MVRSGRVRCVSALGKHSDVILALRREHVELPAGQIEAGPVEYAVKTYAEFRSIEAMEGLVVSQEGDAPVLLRDVARVQEAAADERSRVRLNGVPSISTGIIRNATANPLEVIVAETPRGRGVLGVIDGQAPLGIETDDDLLARAERLLHGAVAV